MTYRDIRVYEQGFSDGLAAFLKSNSEGDGDEDSEF